MTFPNPANALEHTGLIFLQLLVKVAIRRALLASLTLITVMNVATVFNQDKSYYYRVN